MAVGKKKSSPPESTRDAFLRVTVQMIDSHGETAVRLDDVLAQAQASVSSLYHHFGSLRGLIEEAQVQRFVLARNFDVDRLKAGVEKARTRSEFVELLDSVASNMIDNGRAFNRMRRITALASSEASEEMRTRLVQLELQSLHSVVDDFRIAQSRGLIPKNIDIEAATLWGSTVAFSRTLTEILDDADLQERWDEMARRSILQAFGLSK